MDSKSTTRTFEKSFTVSSSTPQLLCIAHTLVADGDSCVLEIYVSGEDTSGNINKFSAWSGRFHCHRSSGVVSASAEMPPQLIDNGGNLSGAGIEVDGDDINILFGFDNWTSGTQYAVGRAMVKIDTL